MQKNHVESVKQRLLNIARKRNEEFNFVLRQYVLQGLMYRLSVSDYAADFLLKGGLLFWVWTENFHRPTLDMDLLCFGNNDLAEIKEKFSRLIQIPSNDCLVFQPAGMSISRNKQGLRVRGRAYLGNALIPYQVDVGFGDAVKFSPVNEKVPVFLADTPVPILKVYPVESVIAEKFQAMIALGHANSRMKDFFDVVEFAKVMPLESNKLAEAIVATFEKRSTAISSEPLQVFSEAFRFDANKQTQWKAFVGKNRLNTKQTFDDVLIHIQALLEPIYMELAKDQVKQRKWDFENWQWY